MKLPEILKVRVMDNETCQPVSNVAIELRLFAASKNNYSIEPLITNANGSVEFSREHCKRSIENAQKMFIMDYAGTLETCRPMVEVVFLSAERVAGMIKQYESAPRFWGQAFQQPDQLFASLRSASNRNYKETTLLVSESDLIKSPQVSLKVKKGQ